ncbi:MAG: hypothetical protein L3J70_06045 [Gammaproteobacteria bacterium]|nr:hypothetical protein [Gammaproteobacteria bacterium]
MQTATITSKGQITIPKDIRDSKVSNADFSDHLLARKNESAGCKTTVTFDKKSSKQPAFKLLK